VADGGRTGLTPVVTGVLFALAAFFSPVIGMVAQAPAITAAALIIVGFLMMQTVRDIPWAEFEEAFPAFMAVVGIPLTYNISYGIGLGFISYVVIKALNGKASAVHWLMWVVSGAFVLAFVMPLIQSLVG
jgi:AGZA family xanthine/uracil permease-like MFS transporter